MRKSFLFVPSCLLGVLLEAGAVAQQKPAAGKYTSIELTRFEVAPDVRFPADYQISLMDDLVEQLESTNRFEEVLRPGEQALQPGAPTLQLTGTVTKYAAGSQALRYLVSFGAGTTRIVARVRFADRAGGEVLLEREVDGKVVVGAMGGESMGATEGLAKEVAKIINRGFFRGIPAPTAKTYSLTLFSRFRWGTTPLKPGSYRLRVAGSKVVLLDELNRTFVRARVRVERSESKFSASAVEGIRKEAGEDQPSPITAISLAGTNLRLVLE